MGKVKILFMLSSMNIGGVEKSLLSLLSTIPKDQYEVTVLLLEKKGGFLSSIPKWVKVEEAVWFKNIKSIILESPHNTIKNYRSQKKFRKITSFILTYFASKYFKNRYIYYKHVLKDVPEHVETYDIAVSYQGPTDTIDYYVAKKVTAARKISWVHFDVSKHQINQRLYDNLYRNYNSIFVVSDEAKRRLIEKIPSVKHKSKTFLNVVSPRIIQEMSKEKAGLDPDFHGIKIVTVGRLSKEKGQDIAIRSLYKLLQEGYPVRWYCVGEGRARKEYEGLIYQYGLEKDFMLLGSTTNPYPFMAQSDIYVQPSRHEGYCLTLAEAKCLSKPIVTMNFTGANEQVRDGFTGFIAKTENELFKKVKLLIDNPSIRTKLSHNLTTQGIELPSRNILDVI